MKHMKKLAIVMAMLTSMTFLASCNSGNDLPAESSVPESSVESSVESSEPESSTTESSAEESDENTEASELQTLVESLYEGIPEEEMPAIMTTPLTEENAEYMAGVPMSDFKEGVASEAAISAIAHSVVLLRANSAEEAEDLAAKVEENANPRKWVCVEAEKMMVKTHDDLVLLIMTSASNADIIAANFDAAFADAE
ncbi:MAG: hypothetical protein ACOX6P_01770 [Candidatus Merdivicinus sp.]